MTDTNRLATALAGRYRLERELGAGGMATVYLAQDLRHDRRVAVKVLRPELAAVIGAERFLAEIKTTANLQHPHILPLFDSGEAGGDGRIQGSPFLFYVMPYVEGETVRDRLTREKQLPVQDALRIATEVASALDYAHRHGVIHRDIKPENILLHDGSALVADFGIALAASKAGGTRMTETGMSLGTPHYMSPEQAMGEREITARSDVYALGCVLYEMLLGEPPFTGPTAQAIVAKVVTAEPAALVPQRKSVPPAVEDAVLTALAKLPADRFGSAAEFAEALGGRATSRISTHGGRQVAPTGGSRQTHRNPAVWVLGALLLGASAIATRQWSTLRHATPDQVVRLVVDLASSYEVSAWDSQGPDIDISPDGSAVAFCVLDAKGARQIYVRRVDEDSGRVVAGAFGGFAPRFSPDGKFLTFWVAGRQMKAALDGGSPQPVTDIADIQATTWSPSGDIVYATRGRASLMRVPAAGGQGQPAAKLDSVHGESESAQYFPVALADGEHVLYSSWGQGAVEDARIGVLDLASGQARRLDVRGTYALGMLDEHLIYTDQAGAVLAVPLDLASGKVRGAPVTLADGIATAARGSAVAALSASGSLAYVGQSREARLVLATPTGKTTVAADAGSFSYPRFSPDGKRVALTVAAGTSSDIWLVDMATGGLVRVTSGGTVNERPEWSPDGERVLFRTVRGARSAIWWQPADGSGPAVPAIASDSADYFEGVVTPDGRAIVYQVDTSGANVLMQDLSGQGGSRPIANTAATEDQARVSPDGQWVAYVTDESGTPQVVVQRLENPGARVQVSERGGREPVWSRDGRRIFYRADEKFWVADVTTTPSFQVTERRTFMNDTFLQQVSPHANYDVSPDGKSLLVIEGEPQRVRVVVNWVEEVRAAIRKAAGR